MFRKMLVANDGSLGGEKALKSALELAKQLEIGLTMVCVEELPNFPASIDEVDEARMDAGGVFAKVVESARALARSYGVALETHVLPGHSVSTVVDFVKQQGFDVLVVGYMGHTALYDRVIGSTTVRLMQFAPCNVFVAK